MVDLNQNTNFQIERDLMNCGLSADSINSIRDTTVITRNGSQHVVPGTQAHLDESGRQPIHSVQENSINQELHEQQKLFSRYKQYSDNRIATLERNLSSTMEQLKELHNLVATIKSNQQAQNRVAISSPSAQTPSEQTPQTNQQPTNNAPANQAIDRNKVAPVDVKVENIFYCGER